MWLQLGLRDAVRMGGEGFCVSVGTLPRGRGIMFGRAPCAQFSAAQHCSLAVLDFGASRGRLVRGNRVGGAWSSRPCALRSKCYMRRLTWYHISFRAQASGPISQERSNWRLMMMK